MASCWHHFSPFCSVMGVCQRKRLWNTSAKQRLQRLLVFEYDPARSRINHWMFEFVSQVWKKRAIEARVLVNLKTCYSGCMSTLARPSIGPSQKKIRVDKPEMSIIIGMAGNVVFQGQDMHAFFIHHHDRNVCKSFRRYRSSWLKKYMWVSRRIELCPQNGGQAAVIDAWAVHGIHTCQPSRSRRDSPDLETETRRPARRHKKADSSRFFPINAQKHDFKPAFCLFSLFFSRNSSFFCLLAFSHVPVRDRQLSNQKICIRQGIVLVKKLILLSFSSERKKMGYISGLLFLAVNEQVLGRGIGITCSKCLESLTET